MEILKQPFDLLAREENPAMFEIISHYGKNLYG